jgi:hypothetical protein
MRKHSLNAAAIMAFIGFLLVGAGLLIAPLSAALGCMDYCQPHLGHLVATWTFVGLTPGSAVTFVSWLMACQHTRPPGFSTGRTVLLASAPAYLVLLVGLLIWTALWLNPGPLGGTSNWSHGWFTLGPLLLLWPITVVVVVIAISRQQQPETRLT